MTTKNPITVEEKLDAALLEIKALRETGEVLAGKVQKLEKLVEDTYEIILAFSQSYYWTPEWQGMEASADEDRRLGRFKRYDDVEEFIREMNG